MQKKQGFFHYASTSFIMTSLVIFSTLLRPAYAVDEIEVYNAEIAEINQWTIQQHLNYTFIGRTVPDYAGGLVPNHSLNSTPELAYGITDWWELGFYAPFAVSSGGTFYSDAFKIRNLFVSSHAADNNFSYGINFEWSYITPAFSQSRVGLEIRPIIGVRNKEWEFIVIRSLTSLLAKEEKLTSRLAPGSHVILAMTSSLASNISAILGE